MKNGIIKAEVGDHAIIVCLPGEPSSWIINESYYSLENVAEGLDDYSLFHANSIYIPEVKLWMDNTKFGCYFSADDNEVHIAVLEVRFDSEQYR